MESSYSYVFWLLKCPLNRQCFALAGHSEWWNLRRIRFLSLQRCHNGCHGVSNHRRHECLLSRLFRHQPKKISKLRVTGLCEGNLPVTGEFPAHIQKASTPKMFPFDDVIMVSSVRSHGIQLRTISQDAKGNSSWYEFGNYQSKITVVSPKGHWVNLCPPQKNNGPVSSLQFGPWINFVLNIDVPYYPAVVQLQWQWNVKGVMVMTLSLLTALQVEVMTTFRARFTRMI